MYIIILFTYILPKTDIYIILHCCLLFMKNLITLNNELCSLNAETWTVEQIAVIMKEFIPRFFPKTSACIFYRQYLETPFIITDKEYPISSDVIISAVSNNRDFSIIEYENKKNEWLFLFPFFSKKKPVLSAVIIVKNKYLKEYKDKAKELFHFLKNHFSHLKQTKKQFLHFENDIEARKFDSLRKFLTTKRTVTGKN